MIVRFALAIDISQISEARLQYIALCLQPHGAPTGQHLLENDQCAVNYVTFPRLIGFVDVTTTSLPSETDIYESPDLAFSFPL